MIVLLGGAGYVGTAFKEALESDEREVLSLRRAQVDYSDVDVLTALLEEKRPEFLINSAGYTGKPNVDACEDHKSDCINGNAVLPGVVRAACEATHTPWGHVLRAASSRVRTRMGRDSLKTIHPTSASAQTTAASTQVLRLSAKKCSQEQKTATSGDSESRSIMSTGSETT